MTNSQRLIARLGLSGLIAPLAVGLVAVLKDAPRLPEADRSTRTTPVAINLQDEPTILPDSLSRAAIERPLFHWTRRPLPTKLTAGPVVAAVDTPPSLPTITLRGAVLSQGHRIAVIEQMGVEDYIHLAEGQHFEGWTLTRVDATRAWLKNQSVEVVLDLASSSQQPP